MPPYGMPPNSGQPPGNRPPPSTWVAVAAGVVGLALVLVGVLFGVPGTGFRGVLAGPSPTTRPTITEPSRTVGPTESTTEPITSSLANGFIKAWTLTPDDLASGPEAQKALQQTSWKLSDMAVFTLATADNVWLVGLGPGTDADGAVLEYGVNPNTGAFMWGPQAQMITGCAGGPVNGSFYCTREANGTDLYSFDMNTGSIALVANYPFGQKLATVDGGTVDLGSGEWHGVARAINNNLFLEYANYDYNTQTIVLSPLDRLGRPQWTKQVPLYQCGDVCPWMSDRTDWVRGSVLVLNDTVDQPTAVDLITGKTLAVSDCPMSFIDDQTLWSGCTRDDAVAGPAKTVDFTDSTGVHWHLLAPSDPEDTWMFTDLTLPAVPITKSDTNGQVHLWQTSSQNPAVWATIPEDNALAYAYDDTHVFIGNSNGDIWALSRETGQLVWHVQLLAFPESQQDQILQPPQQIVVAADGTALVEYYNGQGDSVVIAFSAEDGTMFWRNPDFDINLSVGLVSPLSLISTLEANMSLTRILGA